ncbi:MAG: flagellar motor protein MotA, partial [Xanthobacteraceae bacterium]
VNEAGGNKTTTTAVCNLAEAIQGLVNQMRAEQQTIRDWVESQAEQQAGQHREIKRLLEMIVREDVNS